MATGRHRTCHLRSCHVWGQQRTEAQLNVSYSIKDLARPSTIDDVADFVADYLNTDLLGMVASRHLIRKIPRSDTRSSV